MHETSCGYDAVIAISSNRNCTLVRIDEIKEKLCNYCALKLDSAFPDHLSQFFLP